METLKNMSLKLVCHCFVHRSWKRGHFCPECNVVFGREPSNFLLNADGKIADRPLEDSDYVNCWVCARAHHAQCVKQAIFICAGCQRKTQEKRIGGGGGVGVRAGALTSFAGAFDSGNSRNSSVMETPSGRGMRTSRRSAMNF